MKVKVMVNECKSLAVDYMSLYLCGVNQQNGIDMKMKLRLDGLYDGGSMSMCILPSLGLMVSDGGVSDIWFEWFLWRLTLSVYGK